MIAYKITFRNHSLFTIGKYCLKYKEGEITRALPGTLGIMCFDSLERARAYLSWACGTLASAYRIHKVVGYNKNNSLVSQSIYITEEKLNDFYKHKFNPYLEMQPPNTGTVCFYSVKVLEEVEKE
jgi:hypothetical protein